ncbi:hypothetical protein [Photobacterium leiognathi]|uniref:hypothetical protein n=1 Tax=Photobacterium leiognathi TaxID=553611 RepID=UPI002982A984|nr:hypothetical protein [Photobacterium leiognathi]
MNLKPFPKLSVKANIELTALFSFIFVAGITLSLYFFSLFIEKPRINKKEIENLITKDMVDVINDALKQKDVTRIKVGTHSDKIVFSAISIKFGVGTPDIKSETTFSLPLIKQCESSNFAITFVEKFLSMQIHNPQSLYAKTTPEQLSHCFTAISRNYLELINLWVASGFNVTNANEASNFNAWQGYSALKQSEPDFINVTLKSEMIRAIQDTKVDNISLTVNDGEVLFKPQASERPSFKYTNLSFPVVKKCKLLSEEVIFKVTNSNGNNHLMSHAITFEYPAEHNNKRQACFSEINSEHSDTILSWLENNFQAPS